MVKSSKMFLKRAFLPQVRSCLESRGDLYPELKGEEWFLDFIFFCDITENLKYLNADYRKER